MTDSYKVFQLYCDKCHWKRITTGEDVKDLYEIKTSPIQTNLPKYDPVKKSVETQFRNQKRKFRCPSCGHSMVLRLIPDSQKTLEAKSEIEQRALERKELEESVLRDQNRRKYEEKNRTDGS